MVSYKNNNRDSFGGLLNNIPSIDTSVFEHKPLRDAQPAKSGKSESQKLNASSSQHGSTRPFSGSAAAPGVQPSQAKLASAGSNYQSETASSKPLSGTAPKSNDGLSASQFDALVGDFGATRQSRWDSLLAIASCHNRCVR
jgi:hypothetical protein